MTSAREAGRRALRAARDAVWALRSGTGDAQATGAAMVAVADAFEAVLRRRLRDDEAAPLEIRLSALAPDEIDTPAVIAELRARDRISLETAAGVHELLNVRRRIAAGGAPAARDVELATELGERIEREMARLPQPAATPRAMDDVTLADPAPRPAGRVGAPAQADDADEGSPPPERRSPAWVWGAGVAALGLLLLAMWAVSGSRDRALQEGIVLFRSGAYAEAEPHFRRYAEANPRDVTAQLYLARSYRRMRQFDRAADALRAALAVAPDDAGLQREVGFLLLDTGRPELAVERFRGAVSAEPESADGWLGLVRALRESGRPDAAARVAARAPAEVQTLLGAVPSAAPPEPGI